MARLAHVCPRARESAADLTLHGSVPRFQVRRYAKQKSLPPNWSKLLMNVHSRRGVSLAVSGPTNRDLPAWYRVLGPTET